MQNASKDFSIFPCLAFSFMQLISRTVIYNFQDFLSSIILTFMTQFILLYNVAAKYHKTIHQTIPVRRSRRRKNNERNISGREIAVQCVNHDVWSRFQTKHQV